MNGVSHVWRARFEGEAHMAAHVIDRIRQSLDTSSSPEKSNSIWTNSDAVGGER